MRTKLLSVLAISALLFASCSSDGIEDNTPKAVKFGASINKAAVPKTRAANNAWASNDAIGIFMVGNGNTTIADGTINKQYTTKDGSIFAPVAGNEIYYPMDDTKKVDFIAYYPYLANQAFGDYSVTVATQTSQPAIDLLWSKANNKGAGYSRTSSNVPLVFDHKLSKVILKTTAGDGLTAAQLQGMTVAIIGMNTKATFNLSTGALGTYSAVTEIVPYTVTAGVAYEAIVLPANFAANTLQITFTIGKDVFTWKNLIAADGKFEAGKEYTYNMTINHAGVDFTCTINPWDTTPGRTGIAE